VVKAIETDLAILSQDDAPAPDRLVALKFLGHWVGDVHQPLHVSFKDDRGGNAILDKGPCGDDLHDVWDTCIIERRLGRDVRHAADELHARVTEANRADWTSTGAKAWANESFAITTAATVRYCVRTETGCWYEEDHEILDLDEEKKVVTVDEAYMDAHLPTITQRLTQAGIRLGHLLNGPSAGSRPGVHGRTMRQGGIAPQAFTGKDLRLNEANRRGTHHDFPRQGTAMVACST
jgi:hypothetical protein